MKYFDKIKRFFNEKFGKTSPTNETQISKETERIQGLLHEYFDNNATHLSKDAVDEVNKLITDTMVLSDPQEIHNFESFVLTYMAVGKKAYKEMKDKIAGKINAGMVIDKADAIILADKIIIKKPAEYGNTDALGFKELIKPEKVYTVKICPDEAQEIQSFKFQEESEENKNNILNTIDYFEKVNTKAFYSHFHSI